MRIVYFSIHFARPFFFPFFSQGEVEGKLLTGDKDNLSLSSIRRSGLKKVTAFGPGDTYSVLFIITTGRFCRQSRAILERKKKNCPPSLSALKS